MDKKTKYYLDRGMDYDMAKYFATAERSIDNEEKAVHIANELQEMYDEKFGIDNVRVTITKWQKIGKEIKAR